MTLEISPRIKEGRTGVSKGWFTQEQPEHIDLRAPGIYLWTIVQSNDVTDTYVGKATRLRARMRAYPANVQRIVDGLPYRNGGEYRPVHLALRKAVQLSWQVTVSPLQNCARNDLNRCEAHWIATLRPTLNGSAGRLRWAEMQTGVRA